MASACAACAAAAGAGAAGGGLLAQPAKNAAASSHAAQAPRRFRRIIVATGALPPKSILSRTPSSRGALVGLGARLGNQALEVVERQRARQDMTADDEPGRAFESQRRGLVPVANKQVVELRAARRQVAVEPRHIDAGIFGDLPHPRPVERTASREQTRANGAKLAFAPRRLRAEAAAARAEARGKGYSGSRRTRRRYPV